MKTALQLSMTEALRLTRTGNLAEASSLIQSALAATVAEPAPPPAASGATIELKAHRVSDAPDRATSPKREAVRPQGAGASFEERSYRGPAGTLDYRLYIPADAAPGMPLVIMLHGCTQSPEDFARGTGMNRLADEFGFLVAYPRQSGAANPQRCWNWFKPSDQKRDRGEPALIAGITRAVVADLRADPKRVYVAGLSAGGAAAAIMGAAYPDLYAAIGVHSGLASGAARDLPSAMMAMRSGPSSPTAASGHFVPVITFHGDRDAVVHQANSRQIIAAATAAAGGVLRTRDEPGRSPGGRAYTRSLSIDADDHVLIEEWMIHGAGHAWSGGNPAGSYTDPAGPDATREMLRFFLAHSL
jgi:poly(hydroxyalkanoate) depolymerase family esterase